MGLLRRSKLRWRSPVPQIGGLEEIRQWLLLQESEPEPDILWDDLRVPAQTAKGGVASVPSFDPIGPDGALRSWVFAHNQNQFVYFVVQLPHKYREGSNIYPHVHWAPTVGGLGSGLSVVWILDYTWFNVDDPMTNTTQTVATGAPAVGDTNIAWEHCISRIELSGGLPIDGLDGTDKLISSMLACRLWRAASLPSDNYFTGVALLECDFHYQIDADGSIEEFHKGAAP